MNDLDKSGQGMPFSSGEWKGFYIEPGSARRNAMELFLEFTNTEIFGEGRDVVGTFAIRGDFESKNGSCRWDKVYVGQHTVDYIGQPRAGGIVGRWHIPGSPNYWTGPFFIWHRELGDLDSEFVRAFLEYELDFDFSGDQPFRSAPEIVFDDLGSRKLVLPMQDP